MGTYAATETSSCRSPRFLELINMKIGKSDISHTSSGVDGLGQTSVGIVSARHGWITRPAPVEKKTNHRRSKLKL
jgi:hypothetical protein